MKLSSKEITIIFIEILITVALAILLSDFSIKNVFSSSFFSLILLIIVVVIIIASVFWIIYRRIGEVDEALEKQEIKQEKLEEKLIRYEQLIDIRADIKNLQGKIEKLENGKKSRF